MAPRITARHFTLTDDLRDRVHDRVAKLERFYNGINDAHVILAVERGRRTEEKTAEIVLTVYRQTLSAREAGSTHETALDNCIEGIRRQLVKYKAKLKDTARNYHR